MNRPFTFLILVLFSSSALAEVYRGPISKSSAGTGRAGIPGMESAFVNPALVPLVKASEMSAFYTDGYVASGQHRQGGGLGVIDANKEVLFPGTFHYIRTRDTGRASAPAEGELFHLAFGKNVSEHLAFGASVYRVTYDVDRDRKYEQWNGSVGMLVLITENAGVAYVLDNLAKPSSRTPHGLREDMRQGIGGYGSIADIVRLRADISREERFNPDHKLTYALAVETMTSTWILFRGGFKRDELKDQRLWTAGFGFNGPRMRINYAFEKNAEGTGGAAHSVDLIVPF
jgi:hypothetical protein